MLTKIQAFFHELTLELKRITWPERKELVDSSSVVVIFIFLLAFVIMVCDELIRSALSWIMG